MNTILEKANFIIASLQKDAILAKYIDASYSIPEPYQRSGNIRLILLGQDPTVKDAEARARIRTVLNLDRRGAVLVYLSGVAKKLELDLQANVYATNVYKNFFIHPPTQIKEIDIFQTFLPVWLPLLKDELKQFSGVPIITLGNPILAPLVKSGIPKNIRKYWGYTVEWEKGIFSPLSYIKPEENILGRTIYPFPHLRTSRMKFYKARMDTYIAFVREKAFSK